MEIKVIVEDVNLGAVVGEQRRYDIEDGWSEEPMTLGEAVAQEIVRKLMATDAWNTVRRLVDEIRREEIRDTVRQEIGNALTTPVQATNIWGEPTGAPTTLRERIYAEAKELITKADRHGGQTAMQMMIRQEVDAAIAAELKDAIKAEKEKVVAAVRAKAADLIATAVKEGVGR